MARSARRRCHRRPCHGGCDWDTDRPGKTAYPLALSLVLVDEPSWSVAAAWVPGPPRRVGPPGPQPGASGAGRGGAQRSRLDLIRLNSATLKARAELVCRSSCSGSGQMPQCLTSRMMAMGRLRRRGCESLRLVPDPRSLNTRDSGPGSAPLLPLPQSWLVTAGGRHRAGGRRARCQGGARRGGGRRRPRW
jgi:hypothetical protein